VVKGIDTMDWLERMNGAMDYIETHLLDDIDYEQLAQKALCSNHHFHHWPCT